MRRWLKETLRATLVVIACLMLTIGVADAEIISSPNYKFENTDIGNGGLGISSSPNFKTNLSIGDSGIGTSSSTNFQFEAGSNTTRDPALTIAIISPTASFGSFSPAAASKATTQFSVVDYTSYGYAVQIVGNPPTYGSHTITAMSSNGSSSPGSKQFGINLVANTVPASFGANPNNGQFGHGVAATNYNTTNSYRYVNGETIASAPKSSGQTTYTISYIVNVDSLTPGGTYTSNQSIICTATY